jgi:RHS repeat-associated protein
MRDASGQQYMRNRYYDPATGQFTQPDPIGIAGGLNRVKNKKAEVRNDRVYPSDVPHH